MVKPNSLSKKSGAKSPAASGKKGADPKPGRPGPAGIGSTRKAAKPKRPTGGQGSQPAGVGPGGVRPNEAPPADLSGDTEKRILAAARKEFISKGLEGARMQAIAEAAGVNKALLHYYYRSKENLHEKVIVHTVGTVWSNLKTEFARQSPDGGLEPLVRAAVSTYIRTIAANPDFPLFMLREIAQGGESFPAALRELLKSFGEVPATLTRSLAAEIKAGKIKPMHPVHFFMNLMGMTIATFLALPMLKRLGPLHGVHIDLDESFLEDRIRTITDTLLNGIRIKR